MNDVSWGKYSLFFGLAFWLGVLYQWFGDAIDESALAEQFGVSKTPIREALIQLQAQGWVSNMPRGGSTVAKMNLQQLLSLWELLAELEAVAALSVPVGELHAAQRAAAQAAEELATLRAHADAAAVAKASMASATSSSLMPSPN